MDQQVSNDHQSPPLRDIPKEADQSYENRLEQARRNELELWSADPTCAQRELAAKGLELRLNPTHRQSVVAQGKPAVVESPQSAFDPRTEISADAKYIADRIVRTFGSFSFYCRSSSGSSCTCYGDLGDQPSCVKWERTVNFRDGGHDNGKRRVFETAVECPNITDLGITANKLAIVGRMVTFTRASSPSDVAVCLDGLVIGHLGNIVGPQVGSALDRGDSIANS